MYLLCNTVKQFAIRPALPGDVPRLRWRKATQPLTSTLFGPAIFHDFQKTRTISHRTNEPI